MKRNLVLAGLALISFSGLAQLHTDKNPASKRLETNKTNLEVGAGVMGSVLYLSRNVKEKNDARGYAVHLNYGGTKLMRISFQYTYYMPINIAPTWYNIHAYTLESNLELLARFPNGKSDLYPMLGLSYNRFKGFFTGYNDWLNLRAHYAANSTVINGWLGLNVGAGFQHTIGPVVLFADYRMRVGKVQYGGINIMDVCYGAGVRIKIRVPTLHKTFHKLFRGAKDKYHWF